MNGGVPLGESLVEAAREARRRVLLCAPFAKAPVLERILATVGAGVEIELYTRWRPDEVAAGVSDTAVLPLVRERGGEVLLCDPLHAKLFLFDEEAFVGSANLTSSALGWSSNPNLELLIEVPADRPELAALQEALRRTALPATTAIAEEVERVAALLPRSIAPQETPDAGPDPQGSPWHPLLREPHDLFTAYSDGLGRLSNASAVAAARDLGALEIPAGLDREAFESVVGTRLLQAPLILRVDAFLGESRRFGEVRALLAELLDVERPEAGHAWQTLMRWLLYFLPWRYSRTVPSHSEILVREDRRP